jgi:hypothetical protein
VETGGQRAHGAPIKIFSRAEMEAMLRLAESVGFERTGAVDLDCDERPVRWEQFGLEYSFVLFTLRKPVAQSS